MEISCITACSMAADSALLSYTLSAAVLLLLVSTTLYTWLANPGSKIDLTLY